MALQMNCRVLLEYSRTAAGALSRRSSVHLHFQLQGSAKLLCLFRQHRLAWVDCELSTLDGLPERQAASLGVGSAKLAEEIRSLSLEGQLVKAVDALSHIDQLGIVPSIEYYTGLLRACAKRRCLAQARYVHAHLAKHELEIVMGEFVVDSLVKCGGLKDALQVFYRLPRRSVISWTAIISGFAMARQGHEALRMYEYMRQDGVVPVKSTLISLFRACGSLSDLEEGKRIHAEAMKYRCDNDKVVGTCMVDMYAKCGSLVDAQSAFDRLSGHDAVSWTVLLRAYVQQGQADKALELFEQMLKKGADPDARTFVTVLQASCILAEHEEHIFVDTRFTKVKARAMVMTRRLHACALNGGCDRDVFVGSTLITAYGKCGSIEDAWNVFTGLPLQTVVSWNAMLAATTHQGQGKVAWDLYERMAFEGVNPDDRTFVTIFQACGMLAAEEVGTDLQLFKMKALKNGKVLHAEAWRGGCDMDVFLRNSLLSMYGKCGSTADARFVFDGSSERNAVSWNAMLAVYAQEGQAGLALEMLGLMWEDGVNASDRTFVSALQACGMLAEAEEGVLIDGRHRKARSLQVGKSIHAAAAWRTECDLDVYVGNSLVYVYGKSGSAMDAQIVFDRLCKRDVVSWNVMLVTYVEHCEPERALQLHQRMQEEDGVSSDVCTFVTVLQACGMLAGKEDVEVGDPEYTPQSKCLETGRTVHAEARKKGYDVDVYVGNTLISMYGKCGSIEDAREVFNGLSRCDLVSWNVMLAAYVGQGQSEEVLKLHKQMQEKGVTPDDVTFVSMLQACSNTGNLDLCRQIHRIVVSRGNVMSPLLAGTLVHAYARCASMLEAQSLFDGLLQPNVVSWTALIAGYSREGDSSSCLQHYEKMLMAGVIPNGVTFLSLLSACSHAGLVDKAAELFESMCRDYGIVPEIEHYACMVDLLGRAGYFARVEKLLLTMPIQPNLATWLCLLAACRMHGEVELGKRAFDNALCLQPRHSAAYVLMLNIYLDAGLLGCAKNINLLRQEAGAWKKPGQSWIEHGQAVHTFVVGQLDQSEEPQVCDLVSKLICILKNDGYGYVWEEYT